MRTLTVTELNEYVNLSLENDPLLSDGLILAGEVSGFKKYPSGHSYFTLKDAGASISAVMFAQYFRGFVPENGQTVEVRGRVSIYVKEGRYQLYVTSMKRAGIGALFVAFEMLKKKLGDEGLFRNELKKPIPKFPERIGVVTSASGKAIHDIINVITRRSPSSDIVLRPVTVQGEASGSDIARGIREMNEYGRVDLLIVGRGGGSTEDLWGFNTETVARAIAESRIPVISAVGHETDYTIADMVSDLYAPTPSAAAELAVPEMAMLLDELTELDERLSRAIRGRVTKLYSIVNSLLSGRAISALRGRVERLVNDTARLSDRMRSSMDMYVAERSRECDILTEKLRSLDPKAVLSRGYAIVTDINGRAIPSSSDVKDKDINIMWRDGSRSAEITERN